MYAAKTLYGLCFENLLYLRLHGMAHKVVLRLKYAWLVN